MNKIRSRLLPQTIGFFLMVIGWYVSIVNVGLEKFVANTILTKWSGIGLGMILLGAYLPQVWIFILNRMNK